MVLSLYFLIFNSEEIAVLVISYHAFAEVGYWNGKLLVIRYVLLMKKRMMHTAYRLEDA